MIRNWLIRYGTALLFGAYPLGLIVFHTLRGTARSGGMMPHIKIRLDR